MSLTPFAASTKDNASGQLNSSISASTISIPLQSGQGASFPQPYSGSATSGGTATTLNATGISATIGGSAAVGKFIWNRTDNSVAVILTVNTNSLVTTGLLGGTDNTWENSDAWVIDPFIATFEKHDDNTPYNVTAREESLVTGRSTDTFTLTSSADRGFNGTTAQSFSASDYVYLHVTSPIAERFKDLVSVLAQQLDTNTTNISTNTTNVTNLQTGSYYYVATSGSANAYVAATPALAAYAAGNIVVMKANFSNTGSATLNVNSLGAKTIKKNDGATNLSANDIINGQIVVLMYDGTNFQMVSPIGTPTTVTHYVKTVYLGYSDSGTLSNPTSMTFFDTHTYTVPANDLIAGVAYHFEVAGTYTWGAGTLGFGVGLGSTDLLSGPNAGTPGGAGNWWLRGTIYGTAAAGASVAVRADALFGFSNAAKEQDWYATANVATNGTLVLQFGLIFGSSSGSNSAIAKTALIQKVSTSAFS